MPPAYEEQAVAFACPGETLVGVIARPANPLPRGVLIVVGGPQYRIGSHRQFVLLARFLAAHGIAAMRFDCAGMGDSTGSMRNFEHIQEDIAAAVAQFIAKVPGLSEIFLWGLCDAASASIFYAHRDPRIRGVVLLNPWVRTQAGEAKTYLRHYYLGRALDRGFWKKFLTGRLQWSASIGDLIRKVRLSSSKGAREEAGGTDADSAPTLPERMARDLSRFRGRVLIILSGNDLTAREFVDVTQSQASWRRLMAEPRVACFHLPDANHTFSTRAWRDQVARCTLEWIAKA